MLDVLILAGGLATRLMPYTEKIPKSLVCVAGRPFIYHQLDLLLAQGIKRVILSVGHYGEMIEEKVGAKYKGQLEILYSYDGKELLGTGGAVQNSLEKIKGDIFFVTYGDSFLLEPLKNISSVFNTKSFDSILAVYKNQNRWDRSNCMYANGRVNLYCKKNPTIEMGYIDYGLSIFKKSIFKNYKSKLKYDLGDVMADLSLSGRLAGYEAKSRFYEMGSRHGLLELDAYLKDGEKLI